jgi:hypothetical protein
MAECLELSPESIAALATAFAKATAVVTPAEARVRKPQQSWLAVSALVLAILTLMGAGFGAWVASTNKITALDTRVTSNETWVTKNGARLDTLEHGQTVTQDSATQLNDLKESFEQFRLQYREDTRDLKQQVQDLQQRAGKR